MKPVEPGSTVNTNTTFLLMRQGKVVFDGTAPELGRSRDEYIREYIS
jgi:ABC-type transporter Mla maintaining outer membrane lipid asymmetry ATPase subunit MlaF